MLEQVRQSETELNLRIELEERKIEITTETDGKVSVGGIEHQIVRLLLTDIERAHGTDSHIRTRVSQTVSRNLQVYRKKDINALQVLTVGRSRHVVAHLDILEAERHAGRETQIQILMEPEVGKHLHIYARTPCRSLCKPLLTSGVT